MSVFVQKVAIDFGEKYLRLYFANTRESTQELHADLFLRFQTSQFQIRKKNRQPRTFESIYSDGKIIDEAKLAAEGYGHLRSAIEISVEDDLLKKIVKRYKKGVAFPSLLRLEGGKIDTNKAKINDIYEKCCVSIDGHSSPEEVHTTPTIAELKVDYDEFKKVRKLFTS